MFSMLDATIRNGVRRKFEALAPVLDERSRRQWAAAEAMSLGWGGVSMVSAATGLSRTTVNAGVRELRERAGPGAVPVDARVRRPGGGGKPLAEVDPAIVAVLDELVGPETRGDPMSPPAVDAQEHGQAGGGADPPRAPGVGAGGGGAAQGVGLQPAGQPQDPRGLDPRRSGRPICPHQRPGGGRPGAGPAGGVRGRQEEGIGRGFQERRPRVAAQGQARRGAGVRLHRQGPGQGAGDAVRRLRPGRERGVGERRDRPRHGPLRGPDDPHVVGTHGPDPVPQRDGTAGDGRRRRGPTPAAAGSGRSRCKSWPTRRG